VITRALDRTRCFTNTKHSQALDPCGENLWNAPGVETWPETPAQTKHSDARATSIVLVCRALVIAWNKVGARCADPRSIVIHSRRAVANRLPVLKHAVTRHLLPEKLAFPSRANIGNGQDARR
jgi:hypothetical protein